MNKEQKLLLKILEFIWTAILFILKWLFKIFAFLWILIWEIENVYMRVALRILLTSIFIFWWVFIYDNRETIAKEWVKWAMCVRFPKSCVKREIKEQYYSWSWILNSK